MIYHHYSLRIERLRDEHPKHKIIWTICVASWHATVSYLSITSVLTLLLCFPCNSTNLLALYRRFPRKQLVMADSGVSHHADSSGPPSAPGSSNSAKSLASPRKQGRFLIIEPPRIEEEDDLSDSSSSFIGSSRAGVSRDIESRFEMATQRTSPFGQSGGVSGASVSASGVGNVGAPLSSASSDSLGSAKRVQSPPGSSNGFAAPFVVKNTDGPLFDPEVPNSDSQLKSRPELALHTEISWKTGVDLLKICRRACAEPRQQPSASPMRLPEKDTARRISRRTDARLMPLNVRAQCSYWLRYCFQ